MLDRFSADRKKTLIQIREQNTSEIGVDVISNAKKENNKKLSF